MKQGQMCSATSSASTTQNAGTQALDDRLSNISPMEFEQKTGFASEPGAGQLGEIVDCTLFVQLLGCRAASSSGSPCTVL
jgi:hypothetical protein